ESFEQVRVVPPPEDIPKGVKLDGLLDAYLRQTLPPLRKAAQKADARAFRAAYASAVGQCNGCHKAAGKPFLKVPADPQGATLLDLKPCPTDSSWCCFSGLLLDRPPPASTATCGRRPLRAGWRCRAPRRPRAGPRAGSTIGVGAGPPCRLSAR